jgi:hypothetical protein
MDEHNKPATAPAAAPAPAAKTEPDDRVTEVGGGIISKTLANDPADDPATQDPLWKQRRYMGSKLAKDAGHIIGRAPEHIGLWGKSDTFVGSGILINIDTMEKVRVSDGFKFTDDHVFANSRDLPHALVNGDMGKNLAGGKD